MKALKLAAEVMIWAVVYAGIVMYAIFMATWNVLRRAR